MQDPKAVQFFAEVLSKTKEGRIRWAPTATDAEYLAAIAGKFTLSISEYNEQDRWGNNDVKYALLLKDHDGRILMRITDEDGVTSEDLRELYERARRQALRVDEKIDSVLGELSKL
jgi:hypothetical protein